MHASALIFERATKLSAFNKTMEAEGFPSFIVLTFDQGSAEAAASETLFREYSLATTLLTFN